jgi:hypothetical protein
MALIQSKQIKLARATASLTQSINAGATYSGSITLSKSCNIISITCTNSCWVRLYSSTAAQSADSSRNLYTDPTSASGVIFEINSSSIVFTPVPAAINNQSPVSTSYPITVTNNGSTASITVTITYLPTLEN